jgi:hypothetical protein
MDCVYGFHRDQIDSSNKYAANWLFHYEYNKEIQNQPSYDLEGKFFVANFLKLLAADFIFFIFFRLNSIIQ